MKGGNPMPVEQVKSHPLAVEKGRTDEVPSNRFDMPDRRILVRTIRLKLRTAKSNTARK